MNKTGFYILATIGYLMMIVLTPILASYVPGKESSGFVTFIASVGVVLVFFVGAYIIGISAKFFDSQKTEEDQTKVKPSV